MLSNKKLIQINTVCNTSTGHIMTDIQRAAIAEGYETLSIVGRRKPVQDMPCEKIGNTFSFWIHVGLTTIFDRHGFGSYFTTRKIIRRLRQENPDIIHLHNLHGYYLNLPLLMRYLSTEFQGQIFWTFHDLWPITGHCAHFASAHCMKWREECHHCIRKRQYPISLFRDASKKNFCDKKRMFTSLRKLTIIVPSDWMKQWIEKSFMKDYKVHVIANGVDLAQFHYDDGDVARRLLIRGKYGIPENRKIILGVASVWDKSKGINDFISLAGVIDDLYQIVLVGVSNKQCKLLAKHGIIGIKRTDDRNELTSLYSMADVFINPSVEESFSLVTVEAFACGTPVIVLDTSAVKELVNESNGIVLSSHEAEDYLNALKSIEDRNYCREVVAKTARRYDVSVMQQAVLKLYRETE